MTLVLDSTTKSIEAVLLAAPATQPDFIATWADGTSSVFTEGSSDGVLNGTTPVTIVAAPAASTRRVIKAIRVFNRNASAVTLRLSYKNGSDLRRIVETSLGAGLSYVYPELSPSLIVIREVLTAPRTYFVRTDGNDANTGLVDTPGGAFATLAKARDVLRTLDGNGFVATIQCGNGTHTVGVNFNGMVGFSNIIVLGDTTTPSNVVFSSSIDCLSLSAPGLLDIRGVRLTSSAGFGIVANGSGANIRFRNVDFGACNSGHIQAFSSANVISEGNYSISGGSALGAHWLAERWGAIEVLGRTVTLTGTPNFVAGFAWSARGGGFFDVWSNTFSGGATGLRYQLARNAVCFVNGAGVNYLPGNVAGTIATGAQYG